MRDLKLLLDLLVLAAYIAVVYFSLPVREVLR